MSIFSFFILTEQDLFYLLLIKNDTYIHKRVQIAAKMIPGGLWGIYNPEYITELFLPPYPFKKSIFIQCNKPQLLLKQ